MALVGDRGVDKVAGILAGVSVNSLPGSIVTAPRLFVPLKVRLVFPVPLMRVAAEVTSLSFIVISVSAGGVRVSLFMVLPFSPLISPLK